MFPIFFSVSNSDVAFAEETWTQFPDDWIYLFSKTGRFGAKMWAEIAVEELPRARIFVVFWSKNYPESAGCVKEIVQASALYQSGTLKPVILRLDDHPIHWREGMDAAAKPVFDALKPLLDYRAPAPGTSVEQAKALIAQEAEPLLQSDHPRMPRHDIHRALRTSLQRSRFTLSPACWVSGFNGVGRETLIRELYRDFAPNSRGIVVEINESTLPRQLLLRIESEAFGTSLDRLQRINNEINEDATDAVAHAIERVFASGEFLILRHGRIVQEEVELPEWLDDVVRLLQTGTRPKLFIISQLPLTGDRLIRNREFMSSFRIPTVDEDQLTEFCYQLDTRKNLARSRIS